MKPVGKAFIGCETAYEEASTVVFGAPFEVTVPPRSGASAAPSEMRDWSARMETFSPYLRDDLETKTIFDAGDLNISARNAAGALDAVEAFCGKIHDDEKMPVMIGGGHIITFGAIRAAVTRYDDAAVLHFGPRADLRRDYRGEFFSPFTVMRRVWDLVGDGRIFQFGVRSGSAEEFSWAMDHVRMEQFGARSIDSCAEAVIGRPVYITVDLGVVDPSEMPGVLMPEADGMSFRELNDAVSSLRGFDVIGFDICGLSPSFDSSGVSTALACKLLREMLIAFSRQA